MKINNETAKQIRKDFPILEKKLVYLDNAATSQKPNDVIEIMSEYYKKTNANIHRGIYKISEKSSELYDKSRKITAKFIGAEKEEIIFTKGTTESINLLSHSLKSLIDKNKNEIVISAMEHHSNLVPWQQFAKRNKMKLKVIGLKKDLTLDLKEAKKIIGEKTAIVSIIHISNVLGAINPIEKLAKLAKKYGAISVVDAAQSASRMKIDVKKLKVDFLAFSGHKIMGPMGSGVLYGRKGLLEKIEPFHFGGDMIDRVSFEDTTFAKSPEKFEAGTQNVVGAIGLANAIRYIQKIGEDNIGNWERQLTKYTLDRFKEIKGITVYGKNQLGIISFNLKNIHPHDVATILDDYSIAIRVGNHCAMPLMKTIGINSSCRISFYIYNTFEDIDKLILALKKVQERFNE